MVPSTVSFAFPMVFFLAFLVIGMSIFRSFASHGRKLHTDIQGEQHELNDARVDAERWIERLGSELLALNPSDERAKELTGLAAQRHSNAIIRARDAQTANQFEVARGVAVEGLYYLRDARLHLGEPEGPPLPSNY